MSRGGGDVAFSHSLASGRLGTSQSVGGYEEKSAEVTHAASASPLDASAKRHRGRHGCSNIIGKQPNRTGGIRLPNLHSPAGALTTSKSQGHSHAHSHAHSHSRNRPATFESSSPSPRNHLEVMESRKQEAAAAVAEEEERRAIYGKKEGAILGWKAGTSEIVSYKQEHALGGAGRDASQPPSRSQLPPVSSPLKATRGPAASVPVTEQDDDLFDDEFPLQDENQGSIYYQQGYGTLTEHGIPPPEDKLTSRILSLPNIVCRSACGDVFIVGLNDVQEMLHKRRLGPKGMQIYKNFEQSQSNGWDWEGAKEWKPAPIREGSESQAQPAEGKGEAAVAHSVTTKGRRRAKSKLLGEEISEDEGREGGAAGLSRSTSTMQREDLDEEVRSHLDATLDLVEKHREHLRVGGTRHVAEQERMRQEALLREKREKAMDYVIHKILPQKFLNMAMMTTRGSGRHGAADADGDDADDLFGKMKKALAGEDPNSVQQPTGLKWGKVKSRLAESLNRLPFMKEWTKATKKLHDTGPKGWDAILGDGGDDMYVKNNVKNQGTAVYVLKCQEMGVVPSSQVVQQLQVAQSNMGHCQLRRDGARALRHALVVNTVIRDLDLKDNGLDALAITEIIRGLAFGTMAFAPTKERKKAADKWQSLDWLRAGRGRDLVVNMVPTEAKKALESAHHGLETEPAEKAEQAPVRAQAGSGEATRDSGASPTPGEGFGDSVPATPSTPTPAAEDALKLPALRREVRRSVSMLSGITSVDFSENPLGVNGSKVVADLLDPMLAPNQFLTTIKLNKCGIPEQGGLAFARALRNSNQVLRVLHLANNSLGDKTAAAFGELLPSNRTLTELDLSWNMIKSEGVGILCTGLEENSGLKVLNLSWNGLEDSGVKKVGAMIAANRGLLRVDLTNTRMGSGAALLVAEGIKNNDVLEELILNGNAVGDDGARYLMDALKNNKSLQYLGLQGTNMTSGARSSSHAADFNPLAPDGTYALNLADAADRTIALQLCSLDAETPQDLMKNIKLDSRNVSSCKSQGWPSALPTKGSLSFDFVTRRVRKVMQVMEQKKFQALHGQLSARNMADKEKLALVEVMAPFTYLYCHQIATILQCFSDMSNELVEAAGILFTRAADLEDNLDELTKAMQERDMHALHEKLGWCSYLRYSNPTGHYELHLSTPVHRHITTRLKDVAYGEPTELPSPLGAAGTSPNNNWINLIYDLYTSSEKTYLNFGPPEAWKGLIPSHGVLSFDFVSGVQPPPDATPITDEQLVEFLANGVGIAVDQETGMLVPEQDHERADLQLALLRQEVGLNLYVTCSQVVRIMDCFAASPHRVEVMVMFYSVIVDRKNIAYIVYAMKPMEQAVTLWRLNPANLFDRSHPSGHYILDCANPAHEQVCRKLLELANINNDFSNFWNIRLRGEKKNIIENRNMWGSFTAEDNTPFVEFDYIGTDAYLLCGKTQTEFEALNKGERNDLVAKQAKRMELARNKAVYGYFKESSLWAARPAWQSNKKLFAAQANKTPWMAAWDRVMRTIYSLDSNSGDISADSVLEDIFDEYSTEDNELSLEAFGQLLRQHGYSRAEVHYHFNELFMVASGPSEAPGASGQAAPRMSMSGSRESTDGLLTSNLMLSYTSFVNLIMREPSPFLRWKELPSANPAKGAQAASVGTPKGKAKAALAKKA